MSLRRLGIIGCGGIAELVLSTMAENLPAPLTQVSILASERSIDKAQTLLDRLGGKLAETRTVHTSIAGLLADGPDTVAECASHTAVRDHGAAILAAGCDFVVISIGALADDGLRTQLIDAARRGDQLRAQLIDAARRGGTRLVLPPGAVGGVDALAAAKLSGLESVVYSGRKPPKAWKGSPAERLLALDTLTAPTIFFEGSARQAASEYPFNANVAATLALAGLGLDATQVRLIADPGVTRNVHEVAVRAGCGDFTVRLEGRPSPANPKTSLMAGYSVARDLINRAGPMVI
jgi:aspartate dehydrogenase